MKKFKDKIKKIIYNANIKLKPYILMESNPDFTDNTRYVFDELIKRKINHRYKIIWFVRDKNKFNDIKIKNVKFINRDNRFFNKIKCMYYNYFAGYIVDSNSYILKKNRNQFRIYLGHGMALKLPDDYCSNAGIIDLIGVASDFFVKIYADLFKIPKDKVIPTGSPRTDGVIRTKEELLKDVKRKKTILWLPTYRNHKDWSDNSIYRTEINFKYGVPCISNEKEINDLNRKLRELDVLLLIKLHPVEDSSKISKLDLSNIKIIEDEMINENHRDLNNYLSLLDALITDYSSIYYDYLLTKKPIGLAIPDIDEYSKHVRFINDNYLDSIEGEYIYNYEDLISFIQNIANDQDIKYKKRIEKLKIYQKYDDGNSSKRVVDIIEKHMEGKT